MNKRGNFNKNQKYNHEKRPYMTVGTHSSHNNEKKDEIDFSDSEIVYGRNSVKELLIGDRTVNKLLAVSNAPQSIIDLAKSKKIVIQFVDRSVLDRHTSGENHQGVVAFTSPYEYYTLEELFASKDKSQSLLIILDGISDPHNFGSILRTANAVGADGVIIPKRGSVAMNRTVSKVASGAAEYTKVARVTNLVNSIEKMKEAGYWVVGTAFGHQKHTQLNLEGKIAIVIGAEGEGMSRLVTEKCDFLASIPMLGEVSSLNASVAAGVLMYEYSRQNGFKR